MLASTGIVGLAIGCGAQTLVKDFINGFFVLVENQYDIGQPQVPGIDRVDGDEVEYLLLLKTHPGAQFDVSRELRRRIKASFEKNGIEPGNPNKVYVVDTGRAQSG